MEDHRTIDEAPPTAAAALEIIESAQSRAGRLLHPDSAVFYGIWGAVWLVSGTVTWADAHGRWGAEGVAGVVSAIVALAGLVVSIVVGLRGTRGVRRAGATRSRLYGASWAISVVGLTLLLVALPIEGPTMLVLYPGAFVFLAGTLYLAGGAVWRHLPQSVLGTWTIAVAVASVFAGHPANYLVMAVGGGGGLLATAAYLRRRRAR